jgi:4-hydroxy-tetrahydrodipicolinate synthase
MRNGGAGTISATANVNPATMHELYLECIRSQTSDIRYQKSDIEHQTSKMERQQADLDVVRAVFGNRKFPSMIAALKQAIVIYTDDPAWRTVRPPLVELTPEQAKTLAAELSALGFRWRK